LNANEFNAIFDQPDAGLGPVKFWVYPGEPGYANGAAVPGDARARRGERSWRPAELRALRLTRLVPRAGERRLLAVAVVRGIVARLADYPAVSDCRLAAAQALESAARRYGPKPFAGAVSAARFDVANVREKINAKRPNPGALTPGTAARAARRLLRVDPAYRLLSAVRDVCDSVRFANPEDVLSRGIESAVAVAAGAGVDVAAFVRGAFFAFGAVDGTGPENRTETARLIATAALSNGPDQSELPILADALSDTGFDSPALDYLRNPGALPGCPFVRAVAGLPAGGGPPVPEPFRSAGFRRGFWAYQLIADGPNGEQIIVTRPQPANPADLPPAFPRSARTAVDAVARVYANPGADSRYPLATFGPVDADAVVAVLRAAGYLPAPAAR
jgi:hypothetical protein